MARNTETSSARERARKLQQQQERRQKRASLVLPVIVTVLAVAVIGGLFWWVVAREGEGANYTEGPAPAVANEHGGITLTSSTEIAEGDDLGTIDADELPETDGIGTTPREEGEPPHVIIYTDPGCPVCQQMEEQYADTMAELVDDGLITLEYRTVAVVPSQSNYSFRANNAIACMAEESPENYKSYLTHITSTYAQAEADNETLAAVARNAYDVDISECIEEGTFRPFASYTHNVASEVAASDERFGGGLGTPSVFIDDSQNYGLDFIGPLLEAVGEYGEEIGEDLDADELEEEAEEDADEAETDADEETDAEETTEDDDAE
ncbi:DsbA family protein [Nesterenkonia alba]|uniref:DsbA family protein n=1 Tax=Nesterenkonia alba TaxID=515814 RepID=UPI0003B5147E|nr:thioredoxin domain-containing protein [Nesterenkonia alba]